MSLVPTIAVRRKDQYRSYYPGLRLAYVIVRYQYGYITCICESRYEMARLLRYSDVRGWGLFTVKKEHHHPNTVRPRHLSTFRAFA